MLIIAARHRDGKGGAVMGQATVLAFINTKGGVGKTSLCANLGGYFADVAGQRVLLVDADVQPTLSSYFPLARRPRAGLTDLLLRGTAEEVITPSVLPNLDVLVSNDDYGELNTRLLHAPDGRFRLRRILRQLSVAYDLVLIDSQGARTVLTEGAALAAEFVVSPIIPQMLAAREFVRGTLAMLEDLAHARSGLVVPPLFGVLNAVDGTVDAREIARNLRAEVFSAADQTRCCLLSTSIPALAAYREAATARKPAHHYEPKRPYGRKAPCAAEVIAALAGELFNEIEVSRRLSGMA